MLKRPWLFLLAAMALLPWTGLQTVIPYAIWVAPALLLRYSRNETSSLRAWLLVTLVNAIAFAIQLRGPFIPLPLGYIILIATGTALIRSVPYALDRWLNPKLRSMPRSLVFPVAMTSMEWLSLRYGPYGSWGSMSYSQYYDLPLIQIVSITGIAGLTFLVHWIAPVVNGLLDEAPETRGRPRPALAFLTILGLVLGYGGIRLGFARQDIAMVSVASVVPGERDYAGTFGPTDLIELAQDPD